VSSCCGQNREPAAGSVACGSVGGGGDPRSHFAGMIPNCLAYATEAKRQGRPVVGIMCEYTPRELIMAAGAVPVCLCGGSAKTIPAAEEHLPANLCPLIKSTFGYHVQRGNPFLEMADLVVADTTCDGKKKMFELMGETRPVFVLELPQKPDRPEGLAFWQSELLRLRDELSRRFKTEITDCRLKRAVEAMNEERSLRRQLAELMKRESPPLTGRQLLDLKSSISCVPVDIEQYRKAIELLGGEAADSAMKSRVRVLMTGVPMAHGAERVLEIIENSGGLVVCMENCTGLKPIMEDVETVGDMLEAIARKYYHLPCSVMTSNERRLDLLRQLAAEYRPQCVVELIWQACLTYDVESNRVRRLVEQELNLPYLRIETDYSPSDSARIAVRVEALFEMVRGRGRR